MRSELSLGYNSLGLLDKRSGATLSWIMTFYLWPYSISEWVSCMLIGYCKYDACWSMSGILLSSPSSAGMSPVFNKAERDLSAQSCVFVHLLFTLPWKVLLLSCWWRCLYRQTWLPSRLLFVLNGLTEWLDSNISEVYSDRQSMNVLVIVFVNHHWAGTQAPCDSKSGQ